MSDDNDSGATVINLLDELDDRGELDAMLERVASGDDLDRILHELDGLDSAAAVLLELNLQAAGRAADTLADTDALDADEMREAIDTARDVAARLEAAADTAAERLKRNYE